MDNPNLKPTGYLELENEKIKVYTFGGMPGNDVCGLGKHGHPEHLTVFLTNAIVSVTDESGQTNIHEIQAGTSMWFKEETHVVINSGENPIELRIIEVK